jgi:hypothetical protein
VSDSWIAGFQVGSWIMALLVGAAIFTLGWLAGKGERRTYRHHRSFRHRNPLPNRERELQAARHADIERELVAYLKELREMMHQFNRKFEIDAECLPNSANASDPANPGTPEAQK